MVESWWSHGRDMGGHEGYRGTIEGLSKGNHVIYLYPPMVSEGNAGTWNVYAGS